MAQGKDSATNRADMRNLVGDIKRGSFQLLQITHSFQTEVTSRAGQSTNKDDRDACFLRLTEQLKEAMKDLTQLTDFNFVS
jgi:hypothetical protein